jgi:outer membrane phospholipase A
MSLTICRVLIITATVVVLPGVCRSASAAFPENSEPITYDGNSLFQDSHSTIYTSGVDLLDVPTGSLDLTASSRPTSVPAQTVAERPESSSAKEGLFPEIGGSFGIEEFVNHFAPYEPMYFIGGGSSPNIKFQFSLRYRLFTPTGPLATEIPFFKGFNFAYSQTSFWDVSNSSEPFFYDSSYRPEFFYYLENVPGLKLPQYSQLGIQGGVGHESNGQKDPFHRSLNIVYLRPVLTFGTKSGFFFSLSPKIYDYIGGLELNPDLPLYRGYCDFQLTIGDRDGLQLGFIGRVGRDAKYGSVQLDLTYPLTKLLRGNTDLSLDVQYFDGYGDTLLNYNQRSSQIRVGVALVR